MLFLAIIQRLLEHFSNCSVILWGICISQPPALANKLYLLALAANLYLLALAPNLYLPTLAPNLYLPVLAPDLCLPALAPNLYLPALVYYIATNPGPEFCIYRPCLLNLCVYLLPWSTICITGLGPEFAFTLLLVLVLTLLLVFVIVVVVISLE